jgi:5-methylcytosine-specific restriction enzyme subunit McrC
VLRVREFETVEVATDLVLRGGRLDMYPMLEGKGYFAVLIGTSAARIQAKGFIGLIPINDRLTLEVVPRVPLVNLSRVLEVSRQAPVMLSNAFRFYEAEGELYPSFTQRRCVRTSKRSLIVAS